MGKKKAKQHSVTFTGSEHLDLIRDFVSAARGDAQLFQPEESVLSVCSENNKTTVDVFNQSTGGNLYVIWDAAAKILSVYKMHNGHGDCFRLGDDSEGLFAKGRWKKNSKTRKFVKESRKDQFLGLAPENVRDYFEQLKDRKSVV